MQTTPLHIGIVGCSAEGAALCYRTICAEGPRLLGAHAHPEVSMHTASLAAYVACLERGDLAGVGELMLHSARKLARAGADFVICPDNTIHQAFTFVQSLTPLPWLNIASVVAAEAHLRGYRQAGVLGTHWLVASEVYPEALRAYDIAFARPDEQDSERLGSVIMDELVGGVIRAESTAHVVAIIERLKHKGCDAIILGCTELPLIIHAENSPLPILDSTRLLARAALAHAIHGGKSSANTDQSPWR